MRLEYNSNREESSFILTDFNCAPAQQLLQSKGFYKVLWAKSNDCKITVDGYDVLLKQNQMLFSTTLNILEIPKESGLIAIVFNREFYCIRDHDHEVSCNGLLFFGSSIPPIINLDSENIKSYELIFSIIKEEFKTKDHIQGEMLRVMLKRLLIKSTRLIQQNNNKINLPHSQSELIRKFHLLVELHFRKSHKVADYAEMLFKSPKTLSNLFKKAEHPSPLKVINDRIILESKRLLLFSDKNVEQISQELGYKEGAHFSKFFKTHCGIPPAMFKEKTKKPLK